MPTTSLYAKRLSVLQSFKEVTWGTPAAATARWMAVEPYPSFTPYRASEVFDEARGSLAPGFLKAILRKGGEWTIPGLVTYEDAVFLGHSIFGVVTPTGAGPYVYTYLGALASQATMQPYTFEWLQTGAYVQATGCIGNRLELKGERMRPWTYSLSGFAKDIDPAPAGSLAALTDRTVEVVLMPTTALAMDAAGGAPGTTPFADTLVDFTLSIENSVVPVYTAGSLTPTGWVFGNKAVVSLALTLMWTPTVRTFVTGTLMGGTPGVFQFKSTSGAKILELDVAAALTGDAPMLPDTDGALSISLNLGGIYDTGTLANFLKMVVTSPVATVP